MRRAIFMLVPGLVAVILIAGLVGTAHAMPPRAGLLSRPSIPGTSGRCGSWSAVPSQSVTGDNNWLKGISALSDHDVWAVGFVVPPSYQEQALIEHFDGTAWSIVPDPQPALFISELYGVAAIAANDVWAVGYSAASGGYNQPLILHWDGNAWSVVSSPPFTQGAGLTGISARASDDVWAVGGYFDTTANSNLTLAEHWDGRSWSVVSTPKPQDAHAYPGLNAVTAISTTDVWAVGLFDNSSSTNQTLTEHWNGTAWSIVPSANVGDSSTQNYLTGVAAHSSSDVWAVGAYLSDPANSYDQTLIERWNGSSWTIVTSPNPGVSSWLTGVSAMPGSLTVWAVGEYYDAASQTGYPLTERWDGRLWSTIPAATLQGGLADGLNAVSAIASSDVWTAGISSVPASAFPRSGYASGLPTGHPFGAAYIQITLTERYAQLGPPTGNCPV